MELGRLGMGCSALGNLYRAVTDAEAIAAIHTALARGIFYFDTAPHYGFGLSETRLGMALAQAHVANVVISTKVGRVLVPTTASGPRHGFVNALPFEPVFDYTYGGVMSSFESSLQRLQRARVNILFAHDLGAMTHGSSAARTTKDFLQGGYRAMQELKRAGRIDAIGIGVNETAICDELLDEITLDVILLAGRYTLLEQGALPLLDRCASLGVKVIVGGPFNSGLLVERDDAATHHYNYEAAPDAILQRVRQLRIACERFATPLPAAALQFPLAHPAVICTVAGLANEHQVSQAVEWRDLSIPTGMWSTLRADGLVQPDIQSGDR